MALEPAELAAAGLVQFPTVIGGDVPVVNLGGVKYHIFFANAAISLWDKSRPTRPCRIQPNLCSGAHPRFGHQSRE
jgi:hypothetical protein